MTWALIILDSSAVVAILGDIIHLDLLGAVLKADRDLVIPYRVYKEVYRGPAAAEMTRATSEGKIRVTNVVSELEVAKFKAENTRMNSGEIDVIITHEKIGGGTGSLCILDDKDARKAAEARGVRFVGVIGLLFMMRDSGAISAGTFDAAIGGLKKAGFYMPKEM